MTKRLIKYFIFIFLLSCVFVQPIFAQQAQNEKVFEARVEKILEQVEKTREDSSTYIQQNILLKGLKGEFKDKEVVFEGIEKFEVTSNNVYQVGDKVQVTYLPGVEGQAGKYYITDFVRYPNIYWLAGLFAVLVLIIGRWKGLRALIGLIISFLIIIKFLIPNILAGRDPLLFAIISSLFILIFIIYLTEGLNKKSHVAIISVLLTLLVVGILAKFFTGWTYLSGQAGEETMFLISSGLGQINFKGLLLAGILISALGVLDDMVLSQISAVEEIKKANSNLSQKEIYQRAMKIGRTHLASMANTLFLVYAGAALSLLILFNLKIEPLLSFNAIINNQMLATEIVSTLLGSLGLVLSVPLATWLAVKFLKK